MLSNFISYLFFCNHCKICSELIAFGEELCEECKNDLPRINGEKCKYCGAGKDRCTCKKARTMYDGISAPFYYEKSVKRAIKRYKFNDRPFLASAFSSELASAIKSDFPDVDFNFIDYVPFDKAKKSERLYNPAEVLAKELAKELDLPICNVLTKPFETNIQHTTVGTYRRGNVAGVFDIKDGADVNGKTVLLIDDIKTSGATLYECTRVLKIAGAEKVYCGVVAITADEKTDPET